MNPKENPLGYVFDVFAGNMPDVEFQVNFHDVYPDEVMKGSVSDLAKRFYEQSLFIENCSKDIDLDPDRDTPPFLINEDESQKKKMDAEKAQEDLNILASVLKDIFWEFVFYELPEVADRISVWVRKDWQITVQEGGFVARPTFNSPTSSVRKFLPLLQGISLGETVIDKNKVILPEVSGKYVGRVENIRLRQLLLLSYQMRVEHAVLFDEAYTEEEHCRFADLPHREYQRHVMYKDRFSKQINILNALTGFGILSEKIDQHALKQVANEGFAQVMLGVSNDWRIMADPQRQ